MKLSDFPLSLNNYKTQEQALIEFITADYRFSEQELIDLQRIFNQPAVYKEFSKGIRERPFEREDIINYTNWLKHACNQNKQYSFVIKNLNSRFIGQVEFQITDSNSATLGFWSDAEQSGFISNAIKILLPILPYLKINHCLSYTEPTNQNAIKVLKRVNFKQIGIVTNHRNRTLLKFNLA